MFLKPLVLALFTWVGSFAADSRESLAVKQFATPLYKKLKKAEEASETEQGQKQFEQFARPMAMAFFRRKSPSRTMPSSRS